MLSKYFLSNTSGKNNFDLIQKKNGKQQFLVQLQRWGIQLKNWVVKSWKSLLEFALRTNSKYKNILFCQY